jgi:hypothetical protein
MIRRDTWAGQFGGKAVSGLLAGVGILLMIVTEITPPKFSITVMAISFCFIALGIIVLFIDYLVRQGNRK